MGDVIVIQFATLDGVVSDPDGRWGTGHGGWAFRFGQGPVSDDKFRLGTRMEQGVQLYGRRTWEHFARLWPGRDGDYARLMNAVPKRVATRTPVSTRPPGRTRRRSTATRWTGSRTSAHVETWW